jgi:hypothetical protein
MIPRRGPKIAIWSSAGSAAIFMKLNKQVTSAVLYLVRTPRAYDYDPLHERMFRCWMSTSSRPAGGLTKNGHAELSDPWNIHQLGPLSLNPNSKRSSPRNLKTQAATLSRSSATPRERKLACGILEPLAADRTSMDQVRIFTVVKNVLSGFCRFNCLPNNKL